MQTTISFECMLFFRFSYLNGNDKRMFCYLFLLLYGIVIDAMHFNGGSIRWTPVDPSNNSSSVTITIVQSYWWTYPTMKCATNVPISTPAYIAGNLPLTCIANCSTDGGYSTNPVNILTDCSSASSALGMMTSERSVNIALTSGAQFYLAYQSNAWRSLNNPPISPGAWSIVSYIDLQMRPDGFINTPPDARVVSPQFVIVNRTAQIQIIAFDVNTGDDLRCRWSQSSYNSQVNECGGVCYPSNMPSGTTLSNCTVFFQGSIVGIWYAAAVQVRNDAIALKIPYRSTIAGSMSKKILILESCRILTCPTLSSMPVTDVRNLLRTYCYFYVTHFICFYTSCSHLS
jgi:hypothetical protein